MKRIEDLTAEEMRDALRSLQDWCYVTGDGDEAVWDVNRELSGTDTVDFVLGVLDDLKLSPGGEDDGKHVQTFEEDLARRSTHLAGCTGRHVREKCVVEEKPVHPYNAVVACLLRETEAGPTESAANDFRRMWELDKDALKASAGYEILAKRLYKFLV